MTEKDCGHHHDDDDQKKLYRRLLTGLSAFIVLILFAILLTWLILRPTKPRFVLLDATVYAFNFSSPNLLTTNLQITLSSRNPNNRVGIYYDKLDAYAAYRGQQITLPTLLPPSYQGHKDLDVWSPFLYGNSVPVVPYLAAALPQDEAVGTVLMSVKVKGKVRWRVGSFVSGKYRLHVNCPAYVLFGNKNIAIPVGPGIKYQLAQNCHVDV